jgi:hypothetical protein
VQWARGEVASVSRLHQHRTHEIPWPQSLS